MAVSAAQPSRLRQACLAGTIALATAAAAYAEPGPVLPLLGEGAGEELPDFRSDPVALPRYGTQRTASQRAESPPAAQRAVSVGYDRRYDEQQLRRQPPIHERMRANMRDPQPATVLKLDLR